MRIVLTKPAYHTWTLFFFGVTEEQDWTVSRVVLDIERLVEAEPRPIQPHDMEPGEPPLGRRCGLFNQVLWDRVFKSVGWEYLGADSEDTALKHAMLVCEHFGVELELT